MVFITGLLLISSIASGAWKENVYIKVGLEYTAEHRGMMPLESIIIGNSSGEEKGDSARLQLLKQIIGERILERDSLRDCLIWKDNAFRFNFLGIRYWVAGGRNPWSTLRNPVDICVHNNIKGGGLPAIEYMQLGLYPLVQSIAGNVNSIESQPWPISICYDRILSFLSLSGQIIGILGGLGLHIGRLDYSSRFLQSLFENIPLQIRRHNQSSSENYKEDIRNSLGRYTPGLSPKVEIIKASDRGPSPSLKMRKCAECFGKWPFESPFMGIFLLGSAFICDLLILQVLGKWHWHGLVNIVIAIILFILMLGFIHDALLLTSPS